MFRTSMLAQEESRIFEELLSRFDSLGDEQMLAVGVTPERGQLKNGFERKSCESIGKLQRRTERPRAVFFARNSTWQEAKSCRRYEWHRTRWRRRPHSRGSSVRNVSVTGAAISRNFIAG